MFSSTLIFLSTLRSHNIRVLTNTSTEFLKKKYFGNTIKLFTKNIATEVGVCKMNAVVKSHEISFPTELKIPVPWGYIAAKRWGNSNGKPVLAVHGWQDNAGTFDNLASLLPKDWNLVCIDLPGHGQSSHFPNGFVYNILEYITAIKEITLFLKWDKFDYLGHSMGSGIGFLFAAVFPNSIRCFVSLDAVKGISFDTLNPDLQKELGKFVDKRIRFYKEYDRPAPIQPIEKIMEKQQQSLTQESVKILMKRGVEFLPNGMVRFNHDRRLALPFTFISALSTEQIKKLTESLKCNLLIIKAKQGPWYEKAELYEDFKNLYTKYCKTFKYIEVEGTHHVHLNNPERVLDYITDFMK